MVKKETDIYKEFNEGIDSHNSDIETYRELIPKAKVIIERYKDYFERVSVSYTSIILTPKDKDRLPPLFYCEALELGVLAREIESYGMHFNSCHVNLTLNKC